MVINNNSVKIVKDFENNVSRIRSNVFELLLCKLEDFRATVHLQSLKIHLKDTIMHLFNVIHNDFQTVLTPVYCDCQNIPFSHYVVLCFLSLTHRDTSSRRRPM